MPLDAAFDQRQDGLFLPRAPVAHREEEYPSEGFDVLRDMQSRHFWYRGRHRFILRALRKVARTLRPHGGPSLSIVDLGAGCGGWIAYLHAHAPGLFGELALADSSMRALEFARDVVAPGAARYQVDLLDLPWEGRWDAAFLLDVLEHIPDDVGVLRQVRKALKPGGFLLVTTPAFECFRTYNDELARHVRRYTRRDFVRLAERSGLRLCRSRYFLFFLSPLLVLSRLKSPDLRRMTPQEIRAHLARTHRVPPAPLNALLGLIFGLETPLGHWLPFPWGTSILGVFRNER
jgi:SAM-dependent methyltransferase